jgi:predicted nucleic acid-binding protein
MAAVVLDSSGWIERLKGGPLADACERELRAKTILVPTLVLFEVYRKVAKQSGEDLGLSVVAAMSQHRVVDLSRDIALHAADLSLSLGLAMADSTVLAHAHLERATLITLDNDFAGVDGVVVLRPD